MNTMIVWVLITISGSNGLVTYSPAFATQAECERIKEMIPHSLTSSYASKNKCVKMEIVR